MSADERWDPWKVSAFHSFLLPPVLRNFASGLKQALWGWMLFGFGAAGFGLKLLLQDRLPDGTAVDVAAAFTMIAGALLMTWSKMKCYEFAAPISARWTIVAAFWLDLVAIGIRFVDRQFALGKPVRSLAALCALASAICFLLFLARLSRLVAREDLRRSVWYVFAAMAAAIVAPMIWFGFVLATKWREAPILYGAFAASGFFGVVAFLIYGRLLGGLSKALHQTADSMEASDDDLDEDWGDELDTAAKMSDS